MIILGIAFIVASIILYMTIGYVELLKYCFRASVAVAICSLIFIVPLGFAYLIIGFVHLLLGGLKHAR